MARIQVQNYRPPQGNDLPTPMKYNHIYIYKHSSIYTVDLETTTNVPTQ